MMVDYAYDCNAKSELWIKTVSEWLGGDKEKIKLLQQMFGYTLFTDNALQKFFWLVGNGGNGKSICLSVLMHMLGTEYCTSLQFTRFCSEFDTVMLDGSRANFSFDTKADLSGCSETIKAVTSGDPIVAAHKGVDAQTFKPRTKLFVASNDMPYCDDLSGGMIRRIKFLKFSRKFKETEIDTGLEEKLLGDLPAIFNWAYEGYVDLMENEKKERFVNTKEHLHLMEDFKDRLNPLMVFAREKMYDTCDAFMSETELYAIYKDWCADNGESRMPRTKFRNDICTVLDTDSSPIKAIRSQNKVLFFQFPSSAEETINTEINPDNSQTEPEKEQEQKHEQKHEPGQDLQESLSEQITLKPEIQTQWDYSRRIDDEGRILDIDYDMYDEAEGKKLYEAAAKCPRGYWKAAIKTQHDLDMLRLYILKNPRAGLSQFALEVQNMYSRQIMTDEEFLVRGRAIFDYVKKFGARWHKHMGNDFMNWVSLKMLLEKYKYLEPQLTNFGKLFQEAMYKSCEEDERRIAAYMKHRK